MFLGGAVRGRNFLRGGIKSLFGLAGLDVVSKARIDQLQTQIQNLNSENSVLTARAADLIAIANEYQLKLERKPDYQLIMAHDQIRAGTSNLESDFVSLYADCREFTMTSWERLYALYKAVQYLVVNRIPGDFVECGVWRGGSMRLAAMVLRSLGDTERRLYLYDTFEGMTEPDEARDIDLHGNAAINDWVQIKRRDVKWAYAPIEEVRETMVGSGYPMDKVVLVKGPVEQTIPGTIPEKIGLLRLDTDWHSSTKHEIEHLYPRLVQNGVLALDDYGHYRGAQQAIDEYFADKAEKPLLMRIDYACRFAIKTLA
jgi:outer membrane murein-binding lipoprotein Lpp